jgi:hypothetical protein
LSDTVARVAATEGAPPDHVVLTHPGQLGPYRRELFEEVSHLAGPLSYRLFVLLTAAVVVLSVAAVATEPLGLRRASHPPIPPVELATAATTAPSGGELPGLGDVAG